MNKYFSKYLRNSFILWVNGLLLIFLVSCTGRTSDDDLDPEAIFGISAQINNGQGAIGRSAIPSSVKGKIEAIKGVSLEDGELTLEKETDTCDKKLEFSMWIVPFKSEHKDDPNTIAQGEPNVFWEATTKLQSVLKYTLEKVINFRAASNALDAVLEGNYSVLLKIRLLCKEEPLRANGELNIRRVVFSLEVLEPLIGNDGNTIKEFILTGDNLGSPLKPIILNFLSDPEIIAKGQSSTLLWSIAGAEKLEIDNNVGEVTGLTEKQVTPDETTTYKITASNEEGSTEEQTTVTIRPLTSFLMVDKNINNGEGFTSGTNIPQIGEGNINKVEGIGFEEGELKLDSDLNVSDKKLKFKMWIEPAEPKHKNDPNSIARDKDVPDLSWDISTKLKEERIYSLEDVLNFKAVDGALDPIIQGEYSALLSVSIFDEKGMVKLSGTLSIEQLVLKLAANLIINPDDPDAVVLGGGKGEQTAPVIASFVGNPLTINEGQTTILTWSVSGAKKLEIDNNVGEVTGLTEKEVTPTETTTYTLKASNNAGSNEVQTTIRKNGTPVAEISGGQTQKVKVGITVNLDGSLSNDPDGDPITFSWDLLPPTGSTATLSNPNSATPSFTADVTGSYQIDLTVTDDKGASNTDSVTINAGLANSPPTANAGNDQAVTVGDTVNLDGNSSSDPDGDPITFSWSFVSKPTGSNAILSNPTTATPSFTADAGGDYVINLVVTDDKGASSTTDSVTISANTPPVADAGSDQAVNVGDLVNLDGSASSDPDGDPLTFSWSFTSIPTGSTATLSNPNSATPSFTADVTGSYQIDLTVTDDKGASNTDSVTINAGLANSPPTASAGNDQAVNVGDLVNLDGSASSDPDGDPLTFSWSFTSMPTGSTATLSNPNSSTSSFTADFTGSYQIDLTVTDDKGASNTDSVTINAGLANSPPTANAGNDQAVTVGDTINLDGNASNDPDGDPITFSWGFVSKPTGSNAILSNPTTATPSFTADVSGDYIINLVVTDDKGASSATDSVTISATTPPVANAGSDQAVTVGDTVNLDGNTSSDSDGDPITFSWSFTSRPTGSVATLSNATIATPNFTADVAGNYSVSLTVIDDKGASNTDTVIITAVVNNSPVANAGGNQSASFGDTITLDGSLSSDPDGDPLTFSWTFISKPTGSTATLNGANTDTASFVGDVEGNYEVSLTITDDKGANNTDTAIIVVGAFGWDGGGDGTSWGDPLNWTADIVPGIDSTVAITFGDTITLNSTVTIAGLELLGGTLNGNGQLTVTDSSTWTSGTLAGNGKLILQGATEMSGSGGKSIGGSRIIDNSGTVTWTGTGSIQDAGGSVSPVFNNLLGGVFDIQNDASFSGTKLTFNNDGAVKKTAGTGESSWRNITFNNNSSNTVSVEVGTLILGGGDHSGAFTVAAGATLKFDPRSSASTNVNLTANSSITGAGTLELTGNLGDTINIGNSTLPNITKITGSTVNVNSAVTTANLELSSSSSSLSGTGELTVTDTFVWRDGSMVGTGRTILASGSTTEMSGTRGRSIGGSRIIDNSGTVTWTGTGSIQDAGGSVSPVFNNLLGGVFDIQNDASFSGTKLIFNNDGTVKKTAGTGESSWRNITFNNNSSNTVSVEVGTLILGGGDHSGAFTVAAGATLKFDPRSSASTNVNLTANSSITGAGTLELTGNLGDTINIGNSTLPNITKITGSTVNVNSAVTTANLELSSSSSSLSGTGELTVTDTFVWRDGSMVGTGRTILASGSTTEMSGTRGRSIGGSRIIDNSGTVTWTGTGSIQDAGGSVSPAFNNLSGGVFDVQNDATMNVSGLIFNNAGTLRKTVATGTSNWSSVCYVGQGGTLDIQTGSITFATPPCP